MTIVSGKIDIFEPPIIPMRAQPGCTIADMLKAVPGLPEWFWEYGTVRVDGHEIYRQFWRGYRPLENRGDTPVVVTLHPPIPEGGGDKGKQILTLLATVVLAVVTAGIGVGLLLPGLTAFQAAMVSAGVGIVGRMVIGALTPPPVAPNVGGAQAQTTPQAGISGNALALLRPLPAVLGAIDYSPPHLIRPFTTIHGQDGDVHVHAIVGMAGRYDVADIQVNGVDIDELDGVDYQMRPGAFGDSALTLNNQTCVEAAERIELTNMVLIEPDDELVTGPGSGAANPKWHHVNTAGEADEFSIRFLFPAGLFRQGSTDPQKAIVPLRIEFRMVGSSTWLKGPELHFSSNKLSSFDYRREVIFKWLTTSTATSALAANASNQPNAYWKASPAQSFEYTAESYFNPGSGNFARHVTRLDTGYLVHLQTATFPKGKYEFRVKRGSGFKNGDFTASTYSYDGNVNKSHFFTELLVSGSWVAASTQNNFIDKAILEGTLTRTYDYPFGFTGSATMISIEASAMQVNSISATYSRLAPVWDGDSWADVAATSNPAALYRQVLLGRDNPDAEDESLLRTGIFETWYEDCVLKGYDCNAIVQDLSADQVLQLIASAGWAVPKNNEMRSVIREYDRSEDPIVQKFTPLNSSGMTVLRDFEDLPHALRMEFFDEEDGYKLRDTYVYADGYDSTTATRFEALTESGITNRAKVRDKGLFYLRQLYLRARRYALDVGPEVLISERGDLVGVTSDVLSVFHFFGLVREVILSGSDITGITLRAPVDMSFSDDVTPGISIRQKNGVMLFKEIEPEAGVTDTLTFATPFADTLEIGRDCVVSIGEIGQEYRRCLIHGIVYKNDLSASLALLDVADEMWPVEAPAEEANPGIGQGTAWKFVGASDPVAVASGNLTLTEPDGVADGDLLVACIAMRDTAAFSMPSGMTQIEQANNATTVSSFPTPSGLMAQRVRGASAPSLAFTRTGGDVAVGRVYAFRGNKAASPVDVHGKATTSISPPVTVMSGFTTTEGDELIVFMAAQAPDIALHELNTDYTVFCSDPLGDQFIERGAAYSTLGAHFGVGLYVVSAVKRTAGATGGVLNQMNINVSGVPAMRTLIATAFKSIYS